MLKLSSRIRIFFGGLNVSAGIIRSVFFDLLLEAFFEEFGDAGAPGRFGAQGDLPAECDEPGKVVERNVFGADASLGRDVMVIAERDAQARAGQAVKLEGRRLTGAAGHQAALDRDAALPRDVQDLLRGPGIEERSLVADRKSTRLNSSHDQS